MHIQNSEAAERGILAASIADAESAYTAIEELSEEDFCNRKNALIFSAVRKVVEQAKTPDFVTVATAAEVLGFKEAARYLSELAGMLILSDISGYIEAVKEKSRIRQIYRLLKKAADSCRNNDDSRDIIADISNALNGIRDERKGVIPIKEAAAKAVGIAEKRKNAVDSGHSVGILTGFPSVDGITCGLDGGQLVVLGARSSVGKTALALNMAVNIAKDKRVLYVSLEMTASELAGRILAGACGVPLKKIKSGHISASELSDIKKTELSGNLLISDNFGQTAAEINAAAARVKRQTGLDFMVVDYLQLVKRDRTQNDVQALDDLSRQLKIMAGGLNVPVLVLSQLSREADRKDGGTVNAPRLSDLRGSGAIEQNADIVLLLHRKEREDKDAVLNIAKHRNGATGFIELLFDGERLKFTERPPIYGTGVQEVKTELPKGWEEVV